MIVLNGENCTLETFIQVSRWKEEVSIASSSKTRILQARAYIDEVNDSETPVYGINTGFGKLSDMTINKKDTSKLQTNLLMSHACGVGEPLKNEVVRGMMLLRVNALIKGYSGIRLETLEKLIEFLNKDLIPVVFEKGSLGASGDLAPLSHMSLPLIGLGEVFCNNIRMSAKVGLKKAGIEPLSFLGAKEGLCLINGTQAMTSIGAHILYDSFEVFEAASYSLSLTMEALQGIINAFDPRVHELRGQPGQIEFAKKITNILQDSKLITQQGQLRIQDAYSIRCAPQVHGAILDTMNYVKKIVEAEMNAVTDNPIVFFEEKEVISAGNFHGEPLAFAFDYLGIALSELANISERRIERLVNSSLSNGLPSFLVKTPGLNSGFMIVQYSAASLVSENKVLAHPASVDSIPSSANQEDHVSMGSISARKAGSILDNVRRVIAMELFSACQACDFRGKHLLGASTSLVYQEIRKTVPFIGSDQVMYPYIHQIEELLTNHHFLDLMKKGGMLNE
ncbi:MAG: histidine ammonia-lyase [Acholeplasmataceae bacterium]